MQVNPIVFFGTPEFGVESLRVIHESETYEVALVVTQPDKPRGRGRVLQPTPVKRYCEENDLPFVQPRRMKDPEFLRTLRSTGSPLFVVAAFGRILPDALLEIPQLSINVHASLLPRWRGAAPIARAIMAGDAESGVTIMKVVKELDAGPFFLRESIPIGTEETEGELRQRLASIGGKLLLEALGVLTGGSEEFHDQDPDQVTFAPPIEKMEAQVNWNQSADHIHNHVRALNPNPGAFTWDRGRRLKIWRTHAVDQPKEAMKGEPGSLHVEGDRLWVAAEDRFLQILEIQKEGKAKQNVKQFLSGYKWQDANRWGQ